MVVVMTSTMLMMMMMIMMMMMMMMMMPDEQVEELEAGKVPVRMKTAPAGTDSPQLPDIRQGTIGVNTNTQQTFTILGTL